MGKLNTYPCQPRGTSCHTLAVVRDTLDKVDRRIRRKTPARDVLQHVDEVETTLVMRQALGL